jgi:hypothetical protein
MENQIKPLLLKVRGWGGVCPRDALLGKNPTPLRLSGQAARWPLAISLQSIPHCPSSEGEGNKFCDYEQRLTSAFSFGSNESCHTQFIGRDWFQLLQMRTPRALTARV